MHEAGTSHQRPTLRYLSGEGATLRLGARGLREGRGLRADIEGPVVPAYGMNAACSIAWIAA